MRVALLGGDPDPLEIRVLLDADKVPHGAAPQEGHVEDLRLDDTCVAVMIIYMFSILTAIVINSMISTVVDISASASVTVV